MGGGLYNDPGRIERQMSMDALEGSQGVLPDEPSVRGKLVDKFTSIDDDHMQPPVRDEEGSGCHLQVRARGIQECKRYPL